MHSLLASLNKNVTLVTANSRLAAFLLSEHARAQEAAGIPVWQTATIIPLHRWLERCWLFLRDSGAVAAQRVLLSGTQEGMIWQEVIGSSVTTPPLRDETGAAELARSAWRLMCDWQLSVPEVAARANDEGRVFLQWLVEYQRRLADAAWQDRASLGRVIAGSPALAAFIKGQSFHFVGFDDYSPTQQQLFEKLAACGAEVQLEGLLGAPAAQIERMGFTQRVDEERAAASWARALLDKNPELDIGIVAIDLERRREPILRAFHQVFYPGQNRLEDGLDTAFNISLGQRLIDYQMVADALAILQMAEFEVDREQLSRLLHSSYLGAEIKSLAQGAGLDLLLKKKGKARAGLRHFLGLLPAKGCDNLRAALVGVGELPLSKAARPDHWRAQFDALLALFGWPGSGLNSQEHQLLMSWQQLVSDFSRMALVKPKMDYAEARNILSGLASNTVFQPQTRDRPVQISGVLEATGRRFDALWVMGMQDDSWPAAPRPSPFLSLALQKERGLPQASVERELEYASSITERLCRSADQVLFSWAQREGELELLPSSLIERYPLRVEPVSVEQGFAHQLFAAGELEEISDGMGLALPTAGPVKGGVGLIRNQSECPFKGYATFRLQARQMDELEPGIDARERGSLLHRALEQIWLQLKDSQGLQLLSDQQLGELIEATLGALFEGAGEELFQTLEKQRALALIKEWMALERQRPPFSVIALEQDLPVDLGGLKLRCRVDRIDRTDAGETIIIDYKTGKASASALVDLRPPEPQLPIYAMENPAASAVTFGLLDPEKIGFEGVGKEQYLKGIKPVDKLYNRGEVDTWEKLKSLWHRGLQELVKEISEGAAWVQPRKIPGSCQFCHLPLLCRIDEKSAVFADDEITVADD